MCPDDGDVQMQSASAVWRALFEGTYKSPAELKLKSCELAASSLGDFVCFLCSHGATIGHGRPLGLALHILQQVGDILTTHQLKLLG